MACCRVRIPHFNQISFFVKGFLSKGINTPILALILKKIMARAMKVYRLISYFNFIYKVSFKIIANMLKVTLQNSLLLISLRLWRVDSWSRIYYLPELVKDDHRNIISSRSNEFFSNIYTMDIFLYNNIISVQVNGELAGYFQSERDCNWDLIYLHNSLLFSWTCCQSY